MLCGGRGEERTERRAAGAAVKRIRAAIGDGDGEKALSCWLITYSFFENSINLFYYVAVLRCILCYMADGSSKVALRMKNDGARLLYAI